MPSIHDTPWLVGPSPVESFQRGIAWGDSIIRNLHNKRRLDQDDEQFQKQQAIREAEEARRAQEAAIRFQGYQDYIDDVKGAASDTPDGIITPDIAQAALLKHGPKMFYNTTAQSSIVSNAENRETRKELAAESIASRERLAQENNDLREFIAQLNNQTRLDVAGANNSTRLEVADKSNQTKLDVQDKKNQGKLDQIELEAIWGKYDSKAKGGKVVSEDEFVNRHLNAEMKQLGIDAATAASRLRAAYQQHAKGEEPEDDAVSSEVSKLDKEIKRLEIDLAKSPDKKLLDFGTDNRQEKINELKAQKANLQGKFKAATGKPRLKWNSAKGTFE